MYYIAFPLLTIEVRMTGGKQIGHEINHWKMLPAKASQIQKIPRNA